MEPLNIKTIIIASLMVPLPTDYLEYCTGITGRKGSYLATDNPTKIQTRVEPARNHLSKTHKHQKNLNDLKMTHMIIDKVDRIAGHGRLIIEIIKIMCMVSLGQGF